jgi:DNA-binding response OmpR family regulator
MSEKKQKILIVDDEEDIRVLLGRLLAYEGYMCFVASDGEKALEKLTKHTIDGVITDIKMPGMNGIELTKKIYEDFDIPVMVMTGYASDFSTSDAMDAGARDFIIKPFDAAELCLRLKTMIKKP